LSTKLEYKEKMITTERDNVSTNPAYRSAMQGRYKDAYYFVHASVNTGKCIKGLAALAVVLGFIASGLVWNEFSSPGAPFLVILASAFVGVIIYVFGMLIAAQGQALMAVLDTALNTSPYLDDDSRAEAMSLVNTSSTEVSSKLPWF
jgi:hypothetical protein